MVLKARLGLSLRHVEMLAESNSVRVVAVASLFFSPDALFVRLVSEKMNEICVISTFSLMSAAFYTK